MELHVLDLFWMARKKATPQDPWLLTPYIAEITQFYWLLAFRLMNLFIVKTWFVPDEYFQVRFFKHNLMSLILHINLSFV